MVWASTSRPAPCINVTPAAFSDIAMSRDCDMASRFTRLVIVRLSTSTRSGGLNGSSSSQLAVCGLPSTPGIRTPNVPALPSPVSTSEVAISVLLGTQSVSTQEPPMPSLSTTTTSAPSSAATSAAS